MPNYRRALVPGACWFFTVNLLDRNSRLLTEHIGVLRDSVCHTQRRHPFHIDAMVVLPDHLHAVWTLPEEDCDFSTRWRLIKVSFSLSISKGEPRSRSRQARGERGVWQRRFWEHLIRDERDYSNHIDYCGYNPVKNGLVANVEDWPFSSFHRDNRDNPRPGDLSELNKALAKHAQSNGYGERP